jgi:serine/threonine-protein kinase
VKPQNVLLNGDRQAKVTDFGIARTLTVDGVTQTGTVMGTSNYIAPEQASGQPVDVQTDVYSLGVVLYELLAGDVPFPGDNFVSVAMKHVNEPPPNLLEVRKDAPLRVAAAIDRALEKDPAHRFPTMDAFAAELEACLAALDSPGDVDDGATIVSGEPVTVARPSRRRKPVSRWAVGSIGVGVLALAAVIIGLLALRGIHVTGGPSPAKAAPIHLRGVGAWDPFGDNSEHDDKASLATDKSTSTFWYTEDYRSFTKSGVGLVLDAGRPVKPHGITISTDTPGFTAEIQAGNDRTNFHAVSPPQSIDATTTIRLDLHSAQRYFVVWITKLPGGSGSMHINEVTAS